MKIIYKTFQPTFPKKILFQEPAIGYFSPSLSYTLKTTNKKKKNTITTQYPSRRHSFEF